MSSTTMSRLNTSRMARVQAFSDFGLDQFSQGVFARRIPPCLVSEQVAGIHAPVSSNEMVRKFMARKQINEELPGNAQDGRGFSSCKRRVVMNDLDGLPFTQQCRQLG